MGHGSPEQGHETVAKELIERPLVAAYLVQRQVKEPLQQAVHRLRSQALSQGRGVDQVTEEDGDALAFPSHGKRGDGRRHRQRW